MKSIIRQVGMMMLGAAVMMGTPVCMAQDATGQAIVAHDEIAFPWLSGYGMVKEVRETSQGMQILVTLPAENNNELLLNISETTIVMDNETGIMAFPEQLKSGDTIYVYYSPMMTRSIPPQSTAKAILTNVNSQSVPAHLLTVGEVMEGEGGSIRFLDASGNYLITVPANTLIMPYKTKQIVSMQDIKPGVTLFAWFDVMTLSLPAQAVAERIVVLPGEPINEKEQTQAGEKNQEVVVAYDKLIVNGEILDLEKYPVTQSGEIVLVPLRPVAEALGFKVVWNGKEQVATLDNGSIKTSIKLGEDSYYKASSQAIGLTAAMPLGAPSQMVHGSLYVPSSLFELLFNHLDSVNIVDGVLTIQQ